MAAPDCSASVAERGAKRTMRLIRGKGATPTTSRRSRRCTRSCCVHRSAAEIHHRRRRARGLPGVALIPTAADVGDLADLPCLFNLGDRPVHRPPYPSCQQTRCAVGDAVAFVVARTRSTMRAMPSRRDRRQMDAAGGGRRRHRSEEGAPAGLADKPGNVLFESRSATNARRGALRKRASRSLKSSSIRASSPTSC